MIENREPHQDETADARLTEAEQVAKLMDNGLYVYPYNYPTKDNKERKPRFIKGLIEHGHHDATNDKALIAPLFEPNDNGSINYGVGANIAKSNLICLDFDNHNGSITGNLLLKEMLQTYPEMAKTVKERTPHGMHFYYQNDLTKQEKQLLTKTIENLDGLEILTETSNIAPTNEYSELGDSSLADNIPLPLPKELHEYLNKLITGKVKAPIHTKPSEVDIEANSFKAYKDQYKKDADAELDANFMSGRHNALISYAGKLVYLGYDEQQRIDAIDDYVSKHEFNSKEPITSKNIAQMARYPEDRAKAKGETIRTIYDKFKEQQLIKQSLLALGQSKHESKSVIQARKLVSNWMANNEKISVLPPQVAAEIILRTFHIVKYSEDENERIAIYVDDAKSSKNGLYTQNYEYIRKIINSVNSSYSTRNIEEVLRKIEWLTEHITKPYSKSDRIPVGNGIYNTNTKQLEPYNPKYIFTSKVTTNYNPKYSDASNAPSINNWTLDEWLVDLTKDMDGQPDMEIYTLLWQVMADAVNGNYTHQKAILLYSEHGGSGKGTFQKLIDKLVGDNNVATIKMNQFSERFALARLVGKSVCIGDDNPNGYIKDISNFNSVVTGDPVTVEAKNKNGYTTTVKATVIQSYNELPTTSNKSGIKRRIIIVPFRRHFTDNGSVENRAIKDNYLERKDVLEYALYKALTVYSDFDSYIVPKVSKELLQDFERDNDTVKAFIDESFIEWDAPIITVNALYEAYQRYCEDSGCKPVKKRNFSNRANTLLSGIETKIKYKRDKSRIKHDQYLMLDDIKKTHPSELSGIDLSTKSNVMCFIKQ